MSCRLSMPVLFKFKAGMINNFLLVDLVYLDEFYYSSTEHQRNISSLLEMAKHVAVGYNTYTAFTPDVLEGKE